jgi:hypothetical protein
LGALSPEQFQRHLDLLRWALSVAGARLMWTHLSLTFEPGFREVIDAEALADGAPTSRMIKAFLELDQTSTERVGPRS